jgi:hypothetical protein
MLKIIVTVFLIIAFVPAVRRFLFWLIVGRSMVNEQKKYAQNQQQANQRREGDINVDYVPKNTKGSNYKGGEYIDYEEVD